MLCIVHMGNKIYVFNHPEKDNVKVLTHLTLAAEKQQALCAVIKFIFDGCHGLNPEISERIIDDAFDCVINYEKASLYSQELPKEEREKKVHQVEVNRNVRKEWFKSILKVKE